MRLRPCHLYPRPLLALMRVLSHPSCRNHKGVRPVVVQYVSMRSTVAIAVQNYVEIGDAVL